MDQMVIQIIIIGVLEVEVEVEFQLFRMFLNLVAQLKQLGEMEDLEVTVQVAVVVAVESIYRQTHLTIFGIIY